MNEYDLLKGVAILLVVIGHVTIGFHDGNHGAESTRLAEMVTFGIYLFHMPLFMAISGAVYELSRRKAAYSRFRPFVGNKIRRIIIPYFLAGFLALLPVLVFTTPGLSFSQPSTWFKILLAEDCRHLWYLLALFWIFLLQFGADRLKINLWWLFGFTCLLTLCVSWTAPDFRFMCFNMALRKWPSFILGMIMVRYLNHVSLKNSVILSAIGGGVLHNCHRPVAQPIH